MNIRHVISTLAVPLRFVALLLTGPIVASGAAPILPQATVDVTMPPITRTVSVAPGELQAAINQAQFGDALILTAGETYAGPITLPVKTGNGWIVIATSGAVPQPGVRVGPANAPKMARIAGGVGSVPAINTAPGAHHYRFIGIEFAPASGPYSYGLVLLGTGSETRNSDLPHHIIFDRTYIHGDAVTGGKRGIAANGASIAVIESYVSDWHLGGYDTQAFGSWNGPGPFLLRNSYFEASGENVMFGGAGARIPDLVPSDITIVGNDFGKPLAWRGRADATVKNLFELKNARRVLIDHNTFTNNWIDGQSGMAIMLKSSNDEDINPWSITEHVTFTNNYVCHVGGGVSINTDSIYPARPAAHFLIRGNVFEDISGARWGGHGSFVQLLGPIEDITIDGNWADADGPIVLADGEVMRGLVFTNNVVRHNDYGVVGSGQGTGIRALEYYFPGYVFMGNQLVGGAPFAHLYPSGNSFPETMTGPPFGPATLPSPTPVAPGTVEITVPAGRTVVVSRRSGDKNTVIAITVNASQPVIVNGVAR